MSYRLIQCPNIFFIIEVVFGTRSDVEARATITSHSVAVRGTVLKTVCMNGA